MHGKKSRKKAVFDRPSDAISILFYRQKEVYKPCHINMRYAEPGKRSNIRFIMQPGVI